MPGNTEFWIRPASAFYIQPELNSSARVYDAGQDWGFYYEGTNTNGAFFAGDDVGLIAHRNGTPSTNIPIFIDDDAVTAYPFSDAGNNGIITNADGIAYTAVYGYGDQYVGITGVATWDAGVRGISMGLSSTSHTIGTNYEYPLTGIMGEVSGKGNHYIDDYGQQGVYGWQAAAAGTAPYCQGVTGRTSQSGTQSGGVAGYYTSTVGNLTTNFTAPITYGILGTSFTGVYGYSSDYDTYWAGYFDGDVYVDRNMIAKDYFTHEKTTSKGTIETSVPTSTVKVIEDYGTGNLTNGVAKIDIDNILLELAAKGTENYYVYIQLTGESANGVFVEKHDTYFIVKENNNGKGNITFDWKIIIKDKDNKGKMPKANFENKKMEFDNNPFEIKESSPRKKTK